MKRPGSKIEDIYPLTPMQEGILFHLLYEENPYAYFIQVSYQVKGILDPHLVEQSINELFKRHEVLRTAVLYEGIERPMQVVLKDRQVDFFFEDLRQNTGNNREQKELYITQYKERDIKRSFDLTRDTLMRVTVFRVEDEEYEFILSHHHIIMDGWSLRILISEFHEIYKSFLENREYLLPAVTPYREYIKWLAKQDLTGSKHFWKKYLESYEETACIPRISGKEKPGPGYEEHIYSIYVFEEKLEMLNQLARKNQVTLNTLFQAVWGIMLVHYSGKQDVVFGAIVSGRSAELTGMASMVGLFINTIPVRIRIPAEKKMKFSDLIREVQATSVQSKKHHDFPLVEIQAVTPLKQNLLDHIFVFENYPREDVRVNPENNGQKGAVPAELQFSRRETFELTDYDFNVMITPAKIIMIRFLYNLNQFAFSLVARIARHFETLIDEIIDNPHLDLNELSLLSKEEKRQLLVEFNQTAAPYPADKAIHQVLAEQAGRTPDYIAVTGAGSQENHTTQLTYREFNNVSGRLSWQLKERGVEPDGVVAVMMERSLHMMVSIMAILKTGAAYLPISPTYPQHRQQYILEDSNACLLLTGQGITASTCAKESRRHLYRPPAIPPFSSVSLAYIIYTSGSTGRPKGVMINHYSVINRLNWMQRFYPIGPGDVILQKTPVTFDVSVWELFWWFFAGASQFLLGPGQEKDPAAIIRALEKHRITTMHFVPSMLNAFLDYLEHSAGQYPFPCQANNLKQVFSSGEALLPHHLEKFNRLLRKNQSEENKDKGLRLINLYGPTEATVDVSYFPCPVRENVEMIPIGRPIDNTCLYILDKAGKLLPLGVAGELCIAGAGIARGYLNQPELTAEKFILATKAQRHKDIPGAAKLYKTGDLARWLLDGNIQFLGRFDQQLKIRGFRVEPGEIENQLLTHKEIKEAVITTFDTTGDTRLCAYIVANGAPAADSSTWLRELKLRDFLGRLLPEYMIPSFFVPLDRVPLTASGKVDRNALPAPELLAGETGETYVPPRNRIEEQLVDIWSAVLEMDPAVIGIDANFFNLGGHSLKAIMMASRIHKVFQVKITLGQVFKTPVIRKLAAYIRKAGHEEFHAVEAVEKCAYYPLSSAQKRIYILTEMEGLRTTYNISTALVINGEPDQDRFEKTLQDLIKRHESLRTSFHLREGQPMQVIHPQVDFKITGLEASSSQNIEETVTNFVRPFDLRKAPLVRAGLIRLAPAQSPAYHVFHVFMVDTHHIIADGQSLDILIREFMRLIEGNRLPPLNIQYKDFSIWQNRQLRSAEVESQKTYWLEQLAGEIPVLDMPLDFPRPDYRGFMGSTITFSFSAQKMERLSILAREQQITLNILFLSLYFLLLSMYSGQEDIIAGSLAAGRNHPDLEHVIGMFANFLPIRCKIETAGTVMEFLDSIGKTILAAYENQDYPLEEIIAGLNLPVPINRNPLFDTMFIFHNEIDPGLHLAMDNLAFSHYPLENKTAKLDFKIDAVPDGGGGLNCSLEYNVSLFKEETINDLIRHFQVLADKATENPHVLIRDLDLFSAGEKSLLAEKRKLNAPISHPPHLPHSYKPVNVVISATFTAEPVHHYLAWWGHRFGLDIHVIFAPYNQVFQELIADNSAISTNTGINILLVRFEDWLRHLAADTGAEEKCWKLEEPFNQLKRIFKDKEKPVPYLVGIFPPATHVSLSTTLIEHVQELYRQWQQEAEASENTYVMDFTGINTLYGIDEVFDALADKEGHLPFSSEFYAALGTVMARTIRALELPAFKVIVLDCDNTLWAGICGEDGAAGVQVSPPYRELQEFMVRKYREGFLLALCSKNNEADVWEVFDKNPDMPLKKDHFVSWRINWKSKSENIKSLAEELNLGADSFILLDDSPVECCEVMTYCPEVLTLPLPEDPGSIPLFLHHAWAFDKVVVTEEDRQRTGMYRAEKERRESRTQSQSLSDFLAGLQLKISMSFMNPAQVSRVSQLTFRTNQFNLSTRRRSEEEIKKLSQHPGTVCWAISVSDRFGDYGLVGVVITIEKKESLFIDTLLLSCRVLGRGVEQALLAGLRTYCRARQFTHLEADYYPTPKNTPVLEFLQDNWLDQGDNPEYRTFIYPLTERSESIAFIDFYYQEGEGSQTGLPWETTDDEPAALNRVPVSLDHIAVAVTDLEKALSVYRDLGYNCGDVTYDPLQRSYLVMCRSSIFDSIELAAAEDSESPTHRLTARNGDIPYHLCYHTSDPRGFLDALEQEDIPYEVVDGWKPAVLFAYKRVMFLHITHVGLVELLEDQAADMNVSNVIDTINAAPLENIKPNAVRMVVGRPEPALAFFQLLGYQTGTRINKGNRREITLTKPGSGRIVLLVPGSGAKEEQEFLDCNGPHLYKLCFDQEHRQTSAAHTEGICNHTGYISCNDQAICTPAPQARYRWHIKTVNTGQLVHRHHLLPLEYYTGAGLLELPTYEVNPDMVSRSPYQAPRNQMEGKLAAVWQKILRLEQVGVNDSFFALGGNSLKAITLISEIHKALSVELYLKDIFKHKTIAELAVYIKGAGERTFVAIGAAEKKDYYMLSSAQKRFYILQQMDPQSTAYNISMVLQLQGKLKAERFEKSFLRLIHRHESLRTGFIMIEDRPVQKIRENESHHPFRVTRFRPENHDRQDRHSRQGISGKQDQHSGLRIKDIINDFIRPFDLAQAPLLRVGLLETGEEQYLLMVDMHHIISDGASITLLTNEFAAIYSDGEPVPLNLQYKDFCQWQHHMLISGKFQEQENYWLTCFSGDLPVLNLPLDFPRPVVQQFEGDLLSFSFDAGLSRSVRRLMQETGTTLYMVLLALFNILLSKYSGQKDIIIGTPTAGRNHADLAGVIGLLVETLVTRNYPEDRKTAAEFLEEVKENALNAYENQVYPFGELLEQVWDENNRSRNPLFDAMLAVQEVDDDAGIAHHQGGLAIGELRLIPYEDEYHRVSKVDLTLEAVERDECICFTLEYCTALFKKETMERLITSFREIAVSVTHDMHVKLGDIHIAHDLLTAAAPGVYEGNESAFDF